MKLFDQNKKNAGFTMIELMITVAVVVIMASMAVPNIVQWLPRYRLKNAARDLISEFRKIQMQAVKDNASLTISFDPATDSYYFDTNADSNLDAGERQVILADYKSSISYGSGSAVNSWSGTAIGDLITFNGDQLTFGNRSTANNGTIYLQNINNDICFAVRVLTTGSCYIREYNGTIWVPN